MCEQYTVSLQDSFDALDMAIKLGWYSFKDFDLEEYEYWEHPLNGDLHREWMRSPIIASLNGR